MKKANYSIKRHKQLGEYVLWKEISSEHGFAVKGIFNGTKKECQEKLKEIKGNKYEKIFFKNNCFIINYIFIKFIVE